MNKSRTGFLFFLKWTLVGVFITYAATILFGSSDAVPVVSLNEIHSDFADLTSVKQLDVAGDGQTLTYTYTDGTKKSAVVPGGATNLIATAANSGVKVFVAPAPEPKSQWGTMGIMLALGIVPVLLLIGAMFYLAKRNGSGIGDFGKSKARRIDPKDLTISFCDVALSDEDRREIEELSDFLKNPEDFQRVNAKPPRGILLCGPPGTGKTLVCKAMAKEAGVPFFSVSGSEFDEMLVGAGASRVRDLFAEAQKENNAIVFIDEIDALGSSRSGPGNMSGNNQTVNQILTAMDGFEDSNVIVIGATNRADTLDPALLRPGRFDRIVTLGLPDLKTRTHILKIHLKKVVQLIGEDGIDKIAKGTTGFSGAELAKVVNEGAIFAARDKRSEVTFVDLERAKDKVMMGAESPQKMNDKEISLTAYHEAGHAIVGFLSPEHDPVYKVSIIPRSRSLGITMFMPDDEKYSLSKRAIISQITTLLAGRAAEEIMYGEHGVTTGAANDIMRATALCRKMITKWGLSDLGLAQYNITAVNGGVEREYSEATALKIDIEVDTILETCYNSAKQLLEDNKIILDNMAFELITKETIDRDVIDKLMGIYVD